MPRVEVSPVTSAVGAEIRGLDLANASDEEIEIVRQAHLAHGVIFFRDQTLTEQQHIALAERFGEINVNRFFAAVDGYPQIAEVRKEPDQKANIGGGWHTDHSYDDAPAMGSILLAREVPATGGDTLFASMGAAYDALSDGLKRTLGGLRAVHSSRHVFGAEAGESRRLGGRLGKSGPGHPGRRAPDRRGAPGKRSGSSST